MHYIHNRKLTRKDTILISAAKLFRKNGFKATSMRDIAREVGIEAPSLYNHIKSKDEMLSALCIDIAHNFVDGMETIQLANIDLVDKLKAIINLHIKITLEKTDAISLITDEWRHMSEADKKDFVKLRQDYENDFIQILNAGMEKGVLKKMDTSITLFSILSTLRWLYAWYSVNPNIEQSALESQFHALLLDGLLTDS